MKKKIFRSQRRLTLVTVVSFGCLPANSGQADEVHAINTIVEGHLCVSDNSSCVNPETYPGGLIFNADIKIEDDFPDIFFLDDSTGDRDWQIQVDLLQNGTPDQAFVIGHSDNGSTTDDAVPFVIENGTAHNLLYLDSLERIGINTNAPAFTVDAVGNRIRLSSGGKSIQMRVDGIATDIEAIGEDLFLRSSTNGNNIVMNPFANDADASSEIQKLKYMR